MLIHIITHMYNIYIKFIFVIKVSQPESSESVGIGFAIVVFVGVVGEDRSFILILAVKVQSSTSSETIICNLPSLFTSVVSSVLQNL